MENMSFEELLKINCFSEDKEKQRKASELLEYRYGCEIHCQYMYPFYKKDIDEGFITDDEVVELLDNLWIKTTTINKVRSQAHTFSSAGSPMYQNVTIGSNMKYNKLNNEWENVGSPIIDENVIIADGAKVLGPIVIGKNTVIGAGAIITKDIPENSIAYGVNQYKPKNPDYDLVFNKNMISGEEIVKINEQRVAEFDKMKEK